MQTRLSNSPDYVKERARILRKNCTFSERVLWGHVRKRRLGGFRFRRQQPIGRYIVDFCCVEANLIVEIDGPVHLRQKEYDQIRDKWLSACDATVLRFSKASIENPLQCKLVLKEILSACERGRATKRATKTGSTPPQGDSVIKV